ncbi:MAG TPA: YdjY domain-containing protein, partial [Planctomycetota bacterium]|nr:YdjY domain-containing protein [Planctomycetota bacterium]
MGAFLASAALLFLLGDAPAAPTAAAASPASGTATAVASGVVAFPGIKIFAKERRIECDAAFDLVDGAATLEYLAVAPNGKLHESLRELRCAPEKLPFGLILLGLDPKPEVEYQGEGRPLSGPRVAIEAAWTDPKTGEERRSRVEDLLEDARFDRPMERCGFAFTGSRFLARGAPSAPAGTHGPPPPAPAGAPKPAKPAPREVFAALASGSVIALYHDPDAVLDNPLISGGDVALLAPTFGLV